MDSPQLPPARISSDKSKGAAPAPAPAGGSKKPPNPDRKPRNFPTLQRIYLLTFITKLIRSLFDPNLGPAPARLLHIQHSVLAQLSDADPAIKSYLQPDGLRKFKDRSGKASTVSAIPHRAQHAAAQDPDESVPDDQVDPVAIECLRDIFERGATVQSVEQGVQARAAFYANHNLTPDLSSTKDTSLTSPPKKRKHASISAEAGSSSSSSRRRRTRSGDPAQDTSLYESAQSLMPPPLPPSSAAAAAAVSGSSNPALPTFLTTDHFQPSTSAFGEAILNDAPDPSLRSNREEAALAAAAAAAAAAVAAASQTQAHLDSLDHHHHDGSVPSSQAGSSNRIRTATSGANNEAVAADALRLMKTSAVVNNPRPSSTAQHQSQHARRTQNSDSAGEGVDDDLGPSSSPPGPSGAMAAAISAAQELARQQQELERQRQQSPSSTSSAAAAAAAAAAAVTGEASTAESDVFARELAKIMSAAPSPLSASTVELARSLASASDPLAAAAPSSSARASSATSASTAAEQKAAATKAKSMLLRKAMQVQARSRSQLHEEEEDEEGDDDDNDGDEDSEEGAFAVVDQLASTNETGEELADTYVQGIHQQILAESAQDEDEGHQLRQRTTARSSRDQEVDEADDEAVEDLFSGED